MPLEIRTRSRAKSTGTTVLVIDARISPDFQEDEGGRWVTFCEEHGTFCQHETLRDPENGIGGGARTFAARPEEWCEACQAAVDDKNNIARMGATERQHKHMYGNQIARTTYTPLRDVIGSVETAPGGNLILRVGKENQDGTWQQTGHVVLTPEEEARFVQEIEQARRVAQAEKAAA